MTRQRLIKRLRKASLGNLGDVEPVGDGVFEMREHFGSGWRMYFVWRGQLLVIMLGGGDKSTQQTDIQKAIVLAKSLEDWRMSKKIKVSELPEFDAAQYLNSEEDIAAYLTTVIEENDSSLLAAALGDIARARGMSQVAKDSGITREALYKALRPGSEPRFETVSRVCAALGVRLVAQPIQENA